MNTLYINLFGGPGTGKSTTAALVFGLLKMHKINAELVTEFAKDLVWEERINTLKNQLYITGKQCHRQERLNGKVDIVITDSPLLISCVYTNDDNYKQTLLNKHNEFNNLNIFINRSKTYQKIGRSQTKEEAIKIDKKIIELLNNTGISYIELTDGVNITYNILRKIKSQFKFNHLYEISTISGE